MRCYPDFADTLIRAEPLQRFQSACEVPSHQERLYMCFQLVMQLIVARSDRRFLDRAIHANRTRSLAIGSRIADLGGAVTHAMNRTRPARRIPGQSQQ